MHHHRAKPKPPPKLEPLAQTPATGAVLGHGTLSSDFAGWLGAHSEGKAQPTLGET